MAHWGWYWKIKKKHIPRKLCSQLPSIDSFKLYKNTTIAGFTVQPLDVKAKPAADHLKITYRKHKDHVYIIPIEKQTCNYGGFRSYFKCPLCYKRMRFLYLAEHSIFLCRKCLNLSYLSQRLRPTHRYSNMSKKIKEQIENKGGDLYKKPCGMQNTNYQKLRNKHFYYESKSNQATNQDLREWYGAKIEPYLDDFFDYVDESKEWKKR
jgi:hypothetical protein